MLDGLTTLHQSHYPRCSTRVAKHFEGYWSIQFAFAGAVRLAYDGREAVVRGPCVWTCWPGPWIEFGPQQPNGRWDHRYLAFLGPRVAQWRREGLWFEGACDLNAAAARRLTPMFDDAIASAASTHRLGIMRTISLIDRILIELAETRQHETGTPLPWIDDVMRRLGDMNADDPDYKKLAAKHHMSLSTLRRQFRRATGSSLHDYRLQCRIAEARNLLHETDLPIKQIADDLGYRDVYYFSRQFAQQAGLPPAAYRQSVQV